MRFQQEYECAFLDSETSVFSTDLIQQALVDDFQPFLEQINAPMYKHSACHGMAGRGEAWRGQARLGKAGNYGWWGWL